MSDDPTYSQDLSEPNHRCTEWRPDLPCLTAAEFIERRAAHGAPHRAPREPWLIVDCRPRRERLVSILPGAVSLFQLRTQHARREGKRLLLYCTVGRRSAAHVRRLRKRGLPAYNLQGGVMAWAAAGLPLVTPDGLPTRRVHVHGRPRDALSPGYQAIGAN